MKKLIISLLLILALVIPAIVSCADSAKSVEEEGIILSQSDGMSVNAQMTAPDYDTGGSYSYGEDYDTASYKYEESASIAGSPAVPADFDRMIVRSGNINLVVEDVSTAIDLIKQYAEQFDGWVVSSSMWKNGDKLAGSISFRVQADQFETALRALRDLAVEVTYENTSSQDVTEEYVDLSATLSNLEATEEQFLAIMDKAETVEDIIEVQKELSKVREDIEQTKARMQYLEQTSSTSIIYVQLEQSTMYFEFSADKRNGVKEGEKITFTVSQVSGGFAPYTYLWDFGDDETSTDENPVHSYSDDGYYSVSLTVTDDSGNTETLIREVYIYVQPGWSAGTIAGKAWDGLVSFGKGLLNVLIWVGIFSPVWLIIGGLIFWRIRRKRARNNG